MPNLSRNSGVVPYRIGRPRPDPRPRSSTSPLFSRLSTALSDFTPRISSIVYADGSFELSILKHQPSGRCLREFFCYEGCDEGKGYFISTYQGDGTPLPTFAGEPMEVSVPSPEEVWAALNADNKVSLYTNMNGEVKLFNKNLGD